MNPADRASLANIERLLIADRISVAKALEGAYLLGELSGKVEMARIAEGRVHPVLGPVLDIISGRVRP
jgi:hypothetical protein